MNAFAERFWEIDFFRGIAIVLMVVSNFVTDLDFFNVSRIDSNSGFWFIFARFTASIFIFLVGVSLSLSYSKAKETKTEKQIQKNLLKRGLSIFCWGIAITAVTWFFLREGFVAFGVLHLIGIATILAFPLIKAGRLNLALGIAFIAFGIFLASFSFDFPWLLWLGFVPKGFYSVDYFPLLPWFGIVLIGLFFGNKLYPNHERRFAVPELSSFIPISFLGFLGRHSLKIYLIHQPIIILLLFLSGFAKPI